MTHDHLEQFSDIEFDVLKELSNIGAGNATTAISTMMNLKVNMNIPVIKFLEFKELAAVIGGEENIVVGILLGLQSDLDGMMMFIMERHSAVGVINKILTMNGAPATDENADFNEMDLSVLQELGNIIAGAYLSAISTMTNLTITATVPSLAVDMAGAILSVPAIEYGKVSDRALLIQSQFNDEGLSMDGYFILIPTLESFDKIFTALGL
ncbi:MAG: chemotaxis protein CheC [Lachnospiraceae bacterium]|nr:chemotaxis protein CheC [Lachnospiraceae bacterium]